MPGIGLNPSGCCCAPPVPCACAVGPSGAPTTLHATFTGTGRTPITYVLTWISDCTWTAPCANYPFFGSVDLILKLPPLPSGVFFQGRANLVPCAGSTGGGCVIDGSDPADAAKILVFNCNPFHLEIRIVSCFFGLYYDKVTITA
ncbi:hypothetical protein [Paludisphaera borealis]|uniref:Uncharacterized protein n=1 Tax=Paludisphaera borealis TaxID=1387353 RepID=A0A1U7CNN2_9BACT|nr:hypothetical protein [Paludisphaera borealis]APW60493.1 hypothetical protein BSF38_01963 [Paludisphaera borealis]